jgi:acyl-CoA synthetase (AMP-forming)/AMP-acid ligase II
MDFWDSLAGHEGRAALILQSSEISYPQLARTANKFCAQVSAGLPPAVTRPLILLEAVNSPQAITAYLGALRAHWPVILVAEGAAGADSQILQSYAPNVILRHAADAQPDFAEPIFASQEAVEMHPDLAVLLSTSGTTGAAKLVRLSRQNLCANAEAIAGYLEVQPEDRAITLLPFHYSYGMSVLHIHLLRGAGLVLSEGSLRDAEVRAMAEAKGVTSLALVPTQFELLDRLDWLPRLRYITQAGGRLDPLLAQRFSAQACAEGWKLFIMYGQTEAGPRMSYVPPKDAQSAFHTIGRPLQGGSFRLIDAVGQEIAAVGVAGELVYEGPNVMLGYATQRADLAAPAGPPVLHTGDMAERLDTGYFRITGRASRFIKLFGLRVGLDEVETQLRSAGNRVYASGTDAHLVIFAQEVADHAALRAEIAARYHLPQSAVRVEPLAEVPTLASGKVDYRSLARRAEALLPAPDAAQEDSEEALKQALRLPFLEMERSFLDLGGDSLAYLEVQMHLLAKLGAVPADWEQMPLGVVVALKPAAGAVPGASSGLQTVRADLLARVVSILAVIALHATAWPTGGGSYLLLILVGYSLARFQSAVLFEGNVLRTWRSMLVPILVCYYLLIGLTALVWHPVGLGWFVLLGNFETEISLKGLVPYWFVSAYVQIILAFTLPFLIRPLRQSVARQPLAFGLLVLGLLSLTLLFSGVASIAPQYRQHHPLAALGLLVLGWCIFFAQGSRQRLLMTCVTLAVWWFCWRPIETSVSLLMLTGAAAVIWGVSISLPSLLARALMKVGSLTLFIYIVHAPMISIVLHFGLHSDVGNFLVVTALSLIAAAGFKMLYDGMENKLAGRKAQA